MEDAAEIAPAVESILESARERNAPNRTLSVDARSLPEAFDRAEADRRVPLIAEVKPTSPTTDGQREDDPVDLARTMVEGGAAALSVLTEPDHFGGSPENLRAVRDAVDVPVLRKDFVLREGQLDVVAADVVLLIARFVDDLPGMVESAQARGFQVLVETHTSGEVRNALEAGATIVGVNNRDLAKLEVDLGTFERVAPAVEAHVGRHPAAGVSDRDDVTLIAESGVSTVEDVDRMRRAGADALLVGSAIMDGDVRANARRLTRATDAPGDSTRTEDSDE